MSSRRLAGGVMGALVCAGALANAAPEKVLLVYTRGAGAEACPDEPGLKAQVAAQLGFDPFADEAPTTARVVIASRAQRLHAHIELDDEHGKKGSRELSAGSCAELLPAVVLAIGLAIDPLLLVRGPAPRPPAADDAERPPPARAEIETASTLPSPPPPAPVRSSSRLTMLLGAGVLGAFDAEPAATAGFFVELGIAREWWQLLLEWRGDLPVTGPVVAGGRVRESLVAALLAPCVRHRWAGVCALVGVGSEVGTGLGYSEARSATTVWAAAGGRLAFEIPLAARWRVSARADVLAPFTRTELVVGPAVVWRTPAVSSALGVGVMAELW